MEAVNLAIAFVLAFASTFSVAAVARYVAGSFASEAASRVAAFGVAIGFCMGRFSFSGPAKAENLPAIAAALGSVAAMVAVWAWLIRKREDSVE